MKFLLMTLAAACACFVSCERHEFEGKDGTRQLHEAHGTSHADHADQDHADQDKGEPAPH